MSNERFDSTRLMPGRTGRNDKLVLGMKVWAVIDPRNHVTDQCTITALSSAPTRNIHAVDSQGIVRVLSIWHIRSTLPASEQPDDIEDWLDA